MIYKINPTIKLNDTGTAVINLKTALQEIINKNQDQLLGDHGNEKLSSEFNSEYTLPVFSTNTQGILKLLQDKIIQVPVTGNVDDATANAINKLLNLSAELPAEKMFIMQGTVKSSEGFAVAGKTVIAFDKDLRTEEKLGENITDTNGFFIIKYTASSFTRVEKNSADLLIRVIELKTSDSPEVQLYESNILFNAPEKAVIDVVLPKEVYKAEPEFIRYQNELKPVLDGVEIKDLDEKDINFLTNETGINAQHLSLLAKAFKYGDKQNRMPEVYYGLLRQNLPSTLKELLSVKHPELRAALIKSIEQNIVSDDLLKQIDFMVGILHEIAKQVLIDVSNNASYKGIGAIIARAQISDELKQNYISLYLQKDDAEFKKAIEADPELKFVFTAKQITGDDFNLLSELGKRKAALNLVEGKNIAHLTKNNWTEIITTVPDEITGANEEERKAKYADTLNRKTEKAFPTQVLQSRLQNATDTEHPFGESKNDIVTFISNNETYDVRSTSVSELTNETSGLNFNNVSNKDLLVNNLKGINRLQKVTSSYDGIIKLVTDGITSSFQISEQPQQQFVANYNSSLGGADIARQVHQNATMINRISLQLGVEYFPPSFIPIYGIYGSSPVHPASGTSPATWRNIFGSIDSCDCEHCMSVYSPAAYFTDLLNFLDRRSPTAFNVLMSRRPDLKYILLNCANTNTPLPYIDLVNETLGLEVSGHLTDAYFNSGPDAVAHKKEVQTTWTAEELSANPEHFNALNLDALKNAVYPFSLPYDDALESSRIYLKHFGVELHEVMEVFSTGDWMANDDVAIEYLGLSRLDAAIVTATDSEELPDLGQLYHYYGYGTGVDWIASLTHADIFLQKTSLSYIELLQLLQCNFINPVTGTDEHGDLLRTINLRSADETDPYTCDVSKLELNGLNENWLRKIYRFIRLSKKVGWSFYELDQCLNSLNTLEINPPILSQLSLIKRLQDKLNIPLKELQMLWSDFDLHIYNDFIADGQPKIQTPFEKLFLNNAIINPIDTAFIILVTGDNPEVTNAGEPLAAHKNAITAALQITESDLLQLLQIDPSIPSGHLLKLTDANLSIKNLAVLYRYAILKRQLNLSIEDLLKITSLVPLSGWVNNPSGLLKFINDVEFIRSSKFSIDEIKYVLDPGLELFLTNTQASIDLNFIAAGLKKVPDGSPDQIKMAGLIEQLKNKLDTDADIIEALISHLLVNSDGVHHAADTLLNLVNFEISESSVYEIDLYKKLWKICFVLNKLKLKSVEIKSIHELRADYRILDIIRLNESLLSFEAFVNIVQMVQLRDSLPVAEKSVFELLDITTDSSGEDSVKEQYVQFLLSITKWNRDDLINLLTDWTDASSIPDEYRNGLRLKKLKNQFDFLKRIGASAEFCLRFENMGDIHTSEADAVKNLVKSKYDNAQWLKIAKPLSDKLRIKRRDALLSYLLYGNNVEKHWDDVNELYEYLLIDVQMDACMITSRIKQAIGSVQLFMDRVLMNLEAGVTFVNAEDAIAFADQWKKWRKVYRVWEANRKIFLYPENWIEPELRDNKSPFFKELENQLLQNEITNETAEDALRDYLEKLDAVARLEIMGMYHQKEEATPPEKSIDILHVFGRTYAEPHIYYYRKLENNEWTAWEKVDLDIQGDHLIPVIWNRRLYLFWALFTEKTKPIENGHPSLQIPSPGTSTAAQIPEKYWEIKLAWSEYKGKKWLAKKVNNQNQFIQTDPNGDIEKNEITFLKIIEETSLKIKCLNAYGNFIVGGFEFNTSLNIVNILPLERSSDFNLPINLSNENMLFTRNNNEDADNSLFFLPYSLVLQNDQNKKIFNILVPHNSDRINFFDHLFFQDGKNVFHIFYLSSSVILSRGLIWQIPGTITTQKFLFKSFYHPTLSKFINKLNSLGIQALYDPTLQLDQDYKTANNLLDEYNPNYSMVYDYKPSVNDTPQYPATDKLDFDYDGAYAIYNWELFFHIPLLIATQLNKNQKFEEARKWFHYIFNPTVPSSIGQGVERFWITKPFYEMVTNHSVQTLEELISSASGQLQEQIHKWEETPFQPHIIARMRLEAYMKTVMMKYIDNLIAWGDQLFRQDTIETINEATQLYVLAAQLLGKRPEKIPSRIDKTVNPDLDYNDLNHLGLDEFSNAIINIESYVAVSASTGIDGEDQIIKPFYFCFIPNEKLLSYWDTIADRLFKIRHCMNIEGMVRQLPLFEPPIDSGLLVRAAAAGLDLNTVLNKIDVALPNYRFNVMLQKANELCNDVKSLGAALLSAIEKRDAEELSLIRSGHELKMLEAIKGMKVKQVEEANENLHGLNKSKETVEERFNYYNQIQKISSGEQLQMDALGTALTWQQTSQSISIAASLSHLIPDVKTGVAGFGGSPTIHASFGGSQLGSSLQAVSGAASLLANIHNYHASRASIMSTNDRRWDEWQFQKRIAEKEIGQIDKQIIAATIRLAIAEKDLENHDLQIEHSQKVDDYMRSKFSNRELYEWMKGQIASTYFQSYQLAYDTAKKAEKCFEHELGVEDTSYIQPVYWDSLKKGLLNGEKLQYDLRRLEIAYLEQNKREFEITKHISVAMINPAALMKLRDTGSCEISLPEELFDIDFPGHWFRRIKSVSISIPCIAGPYTNINASLRLTKNEYRFDKDISTGYKRSDIDNRFRTVIIPVSAIATSNSQNDSGVFELNFRDERYLPFEGAGAISTWKLELIADKALRQFDYNSISDIILHLKYTSREDSTDQEEPTLKTRAVENLQTILTDAINGKIFGRLLSLKNDFPDEFHNMKSEVSTDLIAKEFKIGKMFFPYFANNYNIEYKNTSKVFNKNGIENTSITIANSDSEIIDDNWSLALNYNSADLINQEDIYLLINYSLGN